MNRCLHITIHEPSGRSRRAPGVTVPGQPGTDPESNYVMPEPDDPESNYVMPEPDDPESNYVMPEPDDPSSGGWSSSGAGGCSTVVATAGCCCGRGSAKAGQTATGTATAVPSPFVTARDYSGFVIVRLAPGIESPTAPTLWHLADEKKLAGLKTVLERPGETDAGARVIPPPVTDPSGGGAATVIPDEVRLRRPRLPDGALDSRPLVELLLPERPSKPVRNLSLERIHELEKRAALSAFPPLHSLAAYWRVDLRPVPGFEETVVQRLNRLAEVDLAYRELTATDPQMISTGGEVFAEDQGYLEDAPMGIGAAWAWKRLPPSPAKVTLCDLEQGWNPGHNDLQQLVKSDTVHGSNRYPGQGSDGHHGTAVLGQLAATGQSNFGVKGAASDLGDFVLTSHYKDGHNGHVAAAIVQALSPTTFASLGFVVPLKPGDVLLLEVQRALLPTEVDEADFDAIRLASGLGIVVVEAAGNGGFNLDGYTDPGTGRSLRRGAPGFRDSGAILVGASRAALPHDRAPFSNYGSRVDCFGWGETVTTCGYGDLAGTGAADLYTNAFSGTSSASPIIAGAAALLQSLHKAYTGQWLEPRAMRSLLADPATGTRQGPNVPGHIGVMPDLKAILRDRLQVVPDVYIRRSAGNDEISSSPDIQVTAGEVFVALRNRGLGNGQAHIQLFASPAATLITPERWIPVSTTGTAVNGILQGDLPFETPFTWSPPCTHPVPWSFLAVISPEAPSPLGPPFFSWAYGLPPGPPYFDWAEFRAFLRKPGVAWRNIHQVPLASTLLEFAIAGTPERARVFDFEVIQRLPAGTTVKLQVPAALAAKLHQRQPWLSVSAVALTLPERPRTKFRGVELAAGAYVKAAFTVQGTGPQAGHSLALRQLWRGEEVGRITWEFGP
jgi:serine protease